MAVMAHDSKSLFDGTWTRIRSKTIKFSHEMTIENFKLYSAKPDKWVTKSSTFSPKANNQFKCFLEAYPNCITEKDSLAVYLCCELEKISEMTLMFELHLVDIYNTNKHSLESSYTFTKSEDAATPLVVKRTLLFDERNGLLPDDKLTIFCEVVILEEAIPISGECESVYQVDVPKSRIINDFGQLFETRSFSDVTLTVSGKDIKAHKAVLAARSSVFLAMFTIDMEELKMNCVTITDIEYEVFMEMLCFIYTDKAPNLENCAKAIDLLVAADKYDLERLKSMCTEVLCKSLKIKNAVDILIVSHLHNANPLKDAAINFICDRTTYMRKCAIFESMAKSYPGLMIEILCAMSTKLLGLKSVQAEKKVPRYLSDEDRNSRNTAQAAIADMMMGSSISFGDFSSVFSITKT